ncbi:hypothetical protein TRVA0_002S05072 [Trichomonascus vanleenenianus]|uniref:uncharacterized protein n=1 Tax=Trichomonascus vanleenenianus TaxID=2268995 RepID=UPI003ECA3DF9
MDLYDGLEEESEEKKPEIFVEDLLYGDLLDERAAIAKKPVKYPKPGDNNENLSILRFQPRRKLPPPAKTTRSKSYIGQDVPLDAGSNKTYSLPDKTFTFGNKRHPYWDEDYDPSKPNIFEEYAGSDEQMNEEYDWQDYLADLVREKVEFVGPKYTTTGNDDNEKALDESDNEDAAIDTSKANENDAIDFKAPTESFASKLLKKYGWKPGNGLGSNQSGISKVLKFVPSRKRPGTGRIIDKNRSRNAPMVSSVVKLCRFCNDNTDDELPTKLGEECEVKFGPVQQVYIPQTGDVFIKFTNAMSALRMISTRDNELNDTKYTATFFDESKFDKNIFD